MGNLPMSYESDNRSKASLMPNTATPINAPKVVNKTRHKSLSNLDAHHNDAPVQRQQHKSVHIKLNNE
jgi:hypothetical protein